MARKWLSTALAVLIVGAIGMSSVRGAQTCVPFASVVSGVPADYQSYQVKFTWVGEQLKSKKTFGVAGTLASFATSNFLPCVLEASAYNNDQNSTETITLTGTEIQRFIDKLALRPDLQTASVATPDRVMSMQIRRPAGADSQVFEHVAGEIGTRTLLLLLLDSLDPASTTQKTTIIRVKRVFVGTL